MSQIAMACQDILIGVKSPFFLLIIRILAAPIILTFVMLSFVYDDA